MQITYWSLFICICTVWSYDFNYLLIITFSFFILFLCNWISSVPLFLLLSMYRFPLCENEELWVPLSSPSFLLSNFQFWTSAAHTYAFICKMDTCYMGFCSHDYLPYALSIILKVEINKHSLWNGDTINTVHF